jgi:hypothetical protein
MIWIIIGFAVMFALFLVLVTTGMLDRFITGPPGYKQNRRKGNK